MNLPFFHASAYLYISLKLPIFSDQFFKNRLVLVYFRPMQKIFLTYEVNNTVLVKKTKNLVCPLLLKTLCMDGTLVSFSVRKVVYKKDGIVIIFKLG